VTITVSANNGKAPASALSPLPGTNGDGSPHTAPHVTAASYARLRSAMLAAGLGDLVPSSGWSCYRDRAAQQHMRDIGLSTVPVGQSIHGEWTYGSAVDFANLGGFGAARHNWLRANGAGFGWYQPGWAQAGGSLPESWHWEYDQRGDPHDGEVSDMTPDESQRLLNIEQAVGRMEPLVNDVQTRVRGSDPNADMLQLVKGSTDDTWQRVRGPDAGADMLQMIRAGTDQIPPASTTYAAQRLASLALIVAVAVLLAIVVAARTDESDGVYTGVGALVSGLLAWITSQIRTRRDDPVPAPYTHYPPPPYSPRHAAD
jgi:hypothetical protein